MPPAVTCAHSDSPTSLLHSATAVGGSGLGAVKPRSMWVLADVHGVGSLSMRGERVCGWAAALECGEARGSETAAQAER